MSKKPPPTNGFKKGQSGNPAGRPPGIPNKVTRQFREILQQLLEENGEAFQAWVMDAGARNPKEGAELFLKSAEFVTPKLNRTELAGDANGNPVLFKTLVDDVTGRAAQPTNSAAVLPDPRSTDGKDA